MSTNFLGIPVEGDISASHRRSVTQRLADELGPLLFAVLGVDNVEAVRWSQYTPYFNDGDVCEFSANGARVLLSGQDEDTEDDSDYGGNFASEYDLFDSRDYTNHTVVGAKPAYLPVKSLSDALESGAFDNALIEAFGDHATVTVRPTGITVDYYEHY